jgi:diaminopimelate decarboxylase
MQQPNTSLLLSIAKNYGTPTYVYNANIITQQYQKLKNAFTNTNVKIFYAAKALTNINILKHIHAIGGSIDCCSINEVKLALHAGVNPQNILYTSNGIHFTEIAEVVEMGVYTNIDSLSNLEKFAAKYGASKEVGIRLRPNIMAGGNIKIATGHDKSKFGIPVTQLPQILALQKKYNLNITCLHIHTGSDIKDPDVFVQGIEVLFDIMHHFTALKYIDLGGGFKVAYNDNDTVTNIALFAQKIEAAFNQHPNTQHLQIWFEPGKYMVSECGYLLTTVNVLKDTGNIIFAGIDTGFNHLIRPMFYDAYHKIENISNPTGAIKTYTIVGNICETDTFATDRPIHEIRENDILLIYNGGAYGYEMSSNFNSRFKPAEVLIINETPHLIRKRETLEDLLKNQVEVL